MKRFNGGHKKNISVLLETKEIPEYQRNAVQQYMKNLENKIKWYEDQIIESRKELKKHAEFIGVQENAK